MGKVRYWVTILARNLAAILSTVRSASVQNNQQTARKSLDFCRKQTHGHSTMAFITPRPVLVLIKNNPVTNEISDAYLRCMDSRYCIKFIRFTASGSSTLPTDYALFHPIYTISTLIRTLSKPHRTFSKPSRTLSTPNRTLSKSNRTHLD